MNSFSFVSQFLCARQCQYLLLDDIHHVPVLSMRNELCWPRPSDGTLCVTRARRVRFDCFRCASGDAVVRRRPDVAELKARFLQGTKMVANAVQVEPVSTPEFPANREINREFRQIRLPVRF